MSARLEYTPEHHQFRSLPAVARRIRIHAGIPGIARVCRRPHPDDLRRTDRDHEDHRRQGSRHLEATDRSHHWRSRSYERLTEKCLGSDALVIVEVIWPATSELLAGGRDADAAGEDAYIVGGSSSPDEGASDGQQRQNPTEGTAHVGRTPRRADSDRRCRWCRCGGRACVGADRPLVDI